MLSVVGIWLYIFLTTFLVGYGLLQILLRYIPYRIRHKNTYLLCGLAAVTVYAQIFSLFGRVGLMANVLLLAVCAGIAWHSRHALGHMLQETGSDRKEKRFLLFALFLLFAYGTSRGILHYDTGLYHAQSIRWIEEYGAVKGLGNLHCRLAYNSASFALSALYSMAFWGGQSFHCAAGWLAFLLAGTCMEITDALRAGRLRTSDFARLMGIYYLVNIFDEMISPASDYFMVLLAFYVVIRWLELLEESVEEVFPYAMLCVLGVFLMTVKLSAALILLLVLHPAFALVKGRRWKETGLYLTLGSLTAAPFFIRNVLLSGWLVYPFTQIDLFQVPWKIPKGLADYDAREIQVWGRGYTDVTQYELPMKEWLPDWFGALAGSDKLFTLAAVAAVGVLILYAAGMTVGLWRRRWDMLLVQMTVAGSFGFWLCTSPLIRYGCVYVYLMPAVVFGSLYDRILDGGGQKGEGRWRGVVRVCGLTVGLVLLCYKSLALGRQITASYENRYWLVQKEYENYETASYVIEGITFYYPVSGDQVGYEDFPSAPVKKELKLLGEDLADGFAAVL
ncbi:MAG: hypothetical protein K1W10_17565 [Lachnospiraceae bacterium]